jgi:hypothetical protein
MPVHAPAHVAHWCVNRHFADGIEVCMQEQERW